MARCCDEILPTGVPRRRVLVKRGERWLKEIENVVKIFHMRGHVHGDLRLPNFIVDVIDFDFSGKVGQASLPVVCLYLMSAFTLIFGRPK